MLDLINKSKVRPLPQSSRGLQKQIINEFQQKITGVTCRRYSNAQVNIRDIKVESLEKNEY